MFLMFATIIFILTVSYALFFTNYYLLPVNDCILNFFRVSFALIKNGFASAHDKLCACDLSTDNH
jgi:hypothetical protein